MELAFNKWVASFSSGRFIDIHRPEVEPEPPISHKHPILRLGTRKSLLRRQNILGSTVSVALRELGTRAKGITLKWKVIKREE